MLSQKVEQARHVGPVLREPLHFLFFGGIALEYRLAQSGERLQPAGPLDGKPQNPHAVYVRFAGRVGVGPGQVVAGTARKHRDVVTGAQVLRKLPAVRF
jgi:hypothetical protein